MCLVCDNFLLVWKAFYQYLEACNKFDEIKKGKIEKKSFSFLWLIIILVIKIQRQKNYEINAIQLKIKQNVALDVR